MKSRELIISGKDIKGILAYSQGYEPSNLVLVSDDVSKSDHKKVLYVDYVIEDILTQEKYTLGCAYDKRSKTFSWEDYDDEEEIILEILD